MDERLVIATTAHPSQVYGVHGVPGLTYWKCLAPGHALVGPWEAVEWACLPPGGVSGEHLHSRTEELYFVIAGEGEINLDGTSHRIRAGDLVLTVLGARHGMRNPTVDDLSWLVIEMPGAVVSALHNVSTASQEEEDMMGSERKSEIIRLSDELDVDPSSILSGPLQRVRLIDVPPWGTAELTTSGCEHTLFVLAGKGSAASGDVQVPLERGTAVSLILGERLAIDADNEGLHLFCATLQGSNASQASQ